MVGFIEGNPYLATATVQICGAPIITSIKPSTWFAGKTYDNVVIKGTGFTTAEKATADCPVTAVNITAADGSTVPVSGVNVDSDKKITLTVAPPADDTTETATVTLGTAPNTGNSASLATPPQILGNEIHCDPSMNCNPPVISTTDGSTPPTQTVVVGQTISLITNPNLPATIKPLNPTWTLTDGMNIGGYTVVQPDPPPSKSSKSSAKVKETVLDKPSLTTYWLYPNSSFPVTYQYCVDIPGADPVHQCSLEANAIFNVTGPTADITPYQAPSSSPSLTWGWSVSGGFPGCTSNPKELTQFLSFGEYNSPPATCNPTVEFPGIVFAATDVNLEDVTAPNGTFEWVQLLTGGQVAGILKSGGAAPPIPLGEGLDNRYPAYFGAVAQDSPGTGLLKNWANATKTFAAQMYLIWNSNLDSNSIAVPIGYETWSINGTAYNTTASPPWMLGPGSINSPAITNYTASTAQQDSYGMPTWKKVNRNTGTSTSETESVPMDGEEENQQ